MNEGKFKIVTK